MAVPARPDSGADARQGPPGPRPKPDADDDELMDQDDNDEGTGSKTEKSGETDLGALERDLLEYRFSEDDDGEVDGSLLLMAPSSFMSPTKEASADLSPIDPISQARECRSRDPQKLLYESAKEEENRRVYEDIVPQHITRRRMGKISNGVGRQDRSNLESSKLHGEILGRDKAIWDAVHNEGGIEPTHHA